MVNLGNPAGVTPGGHVLVAGGSGLVGYAAARHFASLAGWEVTAVSRRAPLDLAGVRQCGLDLTDQTAAWAAISDLRDVTHVVYAAYHEDAGTQGWQQPDQMARNLVMLRNVMEPLMRHAPSLRHVTLMQGTKAYGPPMAPIPVPARERSPRSTHDAFYFWQEDYLRAACVGQAWTWTILRPQVVFGESLGSHMNMIPAIGVYAAVLKAAGEPLHFPGGPSRVREAVDADLLARACAWAATSPACSGEIFNITNGDVYEWRSLWPCIADALGMKPGQDRPLSLAASMPGHAEDWARIVRTHGLRSPARLQDFVGQGFAYADRQFCHGLDAPPPQRLVSTIKARQAGFGECIDTEEMFRKCFRRFQARGWLPLP